LEKHVHEMKENILKMQEELTDKQTAAQMKLWRSEMTVKQLADKITQMGNEIERLEKVKGIGESISRLPAACLDDIRTQDHVREAKESAIHQALDEARGKGYDAITKEIEEMENKQKRAYVRLYERVGQDIGIHFMEKLDSMKQSGSSEVDKLMKGSKYTSA